MIELEIFEYINECISLADFQTDLATKYITLLC